MSSLVHRISYSRPADWARSDIKIVLHMAMIDRSVFSKWRSTTNRLRNRSSNGSAKPMMVVGCENRVYCHRQRGVRKSGGGEGHRPGRRSAVGRPRGAASIVARRAVRAMFCDGSGD